MYLNRPEIWPLKRQRTVCTLSRPLWLPPWPKNRWCSTPEPDFARPAPLASPPRPGLARHYTASVLAAPRTVIVQNGVVGTLAFFARIFPFLRHCLQLWLSDLGADRQFGRAGLQSLTCDVAKIPSFMCVICDQILLLKIRQIKYKFLSMFCSSRKQCGNFLQIC